jgi:HK97 family phage prohead protease
MKELRAGLPVEIREVGEAIRVSGYAAVFNSETVIGGYFREKIAPGAFSEAVARDDVVFLINHEGLPMARTRSGTLKIKEDERGLFMEADLDPTDPEVQRIVPKMKRGDLDKMSFAFFPEAQEWDESGDIPLRTIKKAGLADVSIVTFPAYNDTEIGLRSLGEHRSAKIKQLGDSTVTRLRMKLALTLATK